MGVILNKLQESLNHLKDEIILNRRYLHQHPELSFEEKETSKFIETKLREYGINNVEYYGKYGLIGRLKGKNPGPTIALRADFDALPIQDQKHVSYRSTVDGVMHACGHDGHTAALLGVGKVLREFEHELNGEIVLLFQPAEEKPPGGAKFMIEDGVLKDVDFIFGAHLDTSLPIGTVAVGSGYKMAAVDYFKIEVNGKGGHGAYPHNTVDSIVIGTTIVNSLQQIVSRKVDPQKSAVLTVGTFHAGKAFNVIPDSAVIEGTVRTFEEEVQNLIEQEIKSVSSGIAQAFGATASVKYERGYPSLYNHVEETKAIQEAFREIFGDSVVPFQSTMGAEDFAYYLKNIPGSYFKVGAHNDDPKTQFPHHHPEFDFDEEALLNIGKAFLAIINRYAISK